MAYRKSKGSWWMLRNSSGKKDIAMTMMIASWLLTCALAVVGSLEAVEFSGYSFAFNEFNMGFATTVLVPLIGLYFGRRWTDANRGAYKLQALYGRKDPDFDDDDYEQPEDDDYED